MRIIIILITDDRHRVNAEEITEKSFSSKWKVIYFAVNGLNVGLNPEETLRVLDGLQTGGLCPASRAPGGATL
ncbi:MAG: hypothetical protein HY308_11035 [Gammaproteobacteria bacterium]|nr:hypothetical protein [Gammaproteobacteria bacterium]